MKKTIAVLLAVLLLTCLCACGAKDDVVFKNDLSVVLCGVHISPSSEDTWGDALNYARLSAGSSIHIDFERFGYDGDAYDVGLIDENSRNYDVYDVSLSVGDTLSISEKDGGAVLTVTGADGSAKEYPAYVYES